MREQESFEHWTWPISRDNYNTTHLLSSAEQAFLTNDPEVKINLSAARFPALEPVRRLIDPLEDVFLYVNISRSKRNQLLRLVLQEVAKRQISFWGWTDQDWVDLAAANRYFAGWLISAAFLLCNFQGLYLFPKRSQIFSSLARRVFGDERINSIARQIQGELEAFGYKKRTRRLVPLTVAHLLLLVKSPRAEDISTAAFQLLQKNTASAPAEKCLIAVSRALVSRGILDQPIKRLSRARYMDEPHGLFENIAAEWARLAQYWYDHSTATPKVKLNRYYRVLAVGRWLTARHPDIQSPEQWTRTTAADSVVMMMEEKTGEWSHFPSQRIVNFGRPFAASTRIGRLTSLRIFFQDLQQWEIIPRRFDPYRAFRSPRSLACLLERNPRVLADDIWAKLIWAGLNLADSDLRGQGGHGGRAHMYPFQFVRAVIIVWLFGGLRWDEIRRLRLGCIRWQDDASGERVCLLSVPVNKTSTAFTKPVDRLAGEAIEAWEKERPVQAKLLEVKTGMQVDYLFLHRMHLMGEAYLNHILIPALCKKAGLPCVDVRGRITGHRARSTIASQLFNAREPMSLFELQQWLGHKQPSSTQHYIKITPTKLMNSYAKAGYFERNVRAIEVLIDQDLVRKGLAGKEPWRFFDLGHGYCTYDFFDQCPHRMACAQCSFYVPKHSTHAQLLEAKSNLLRLRQDIPLSEPELAAVDDGITAYEKLLAGLLDTPAPDGVTPRQLSESRLHQIPTVAK